jgi:hypothetical protein
MPNKCVTNSVSDVGATGQDQLQCKCLNVVPSLALPGCASLRPFQAHILVNPSANIITVNPNTSLA